MTSFIGVGTSEQNRALVYGQNAIHLAKSKEDGYKRYSAWRHVMVQIIAALLTKPQENSSMKKQESRSVLGWVGYTQVILGCRAGT
jgi:hypothetical protein